MGRFLDESQGGGSAALGSAAGPIRHLQQRLRTEDIRRVLVSQSFCQVTSVLMSDPAYGRLKLADLEWLVLPAIVSGQFRLGIPCGPRARATTSLLKGVSIPSAAILWATVSSEIDAVLADPSSKQFRLSADDWIGGDHAWIMAAAGRTREVKRLLSELGRDTFPGMSVRMRIPTSGSRARVLDLDDYVSGRISHALSTSLEVLESS